MKIGVMLLLTYAIAVTNLATAAPAQSWPALRYIGFSADFGPTDEAERLALRRSVCYGLNRDALVRAVAATLPPARAGVKPAFGIQNPELQGYNPDVRAYPYSPGLARENFNKSGWAGELVFLVGPNPTPTHQAFYRAVEDSLRTTLDGATIGVRSVANFDALFREIRRDTVPTYIHRWLGLPGTPGFPSFALMIAERYRAADLELGKLVAAGDSKGAESYLLEKAFICPGVWEPQ